MSRTSGVAGKVAGLCAVVMLAGCGSSSLPPELGNEPGFDGGVVVSPIAGVPTSATSYTVLVAGTVPVAPGVKVGYALTAPQRMTYTFRWTGDAAVTGDGYQSFWGSIWTTGHFTSLTPGCVNQILPPREWRLRLGDHAGLGRRAHRLGHRRVDGMGWLQLHDGHGARLLRRLDRRQPAPRNLRVRRGALRRHQRAGGEPLRDVVHVAGGPFAAHPPSLARLSSRLRRARASHRRRPRHVE